MENKKIKSITSGRKNLTTKIIDTAIAFHSNEIRGYSRELGFTNVS